MGENKIAIEKFDGSEFSWWKVQIEAVLCQKDLDVVLGDKPEKLEKEEAANWEAMDKKARAVIMLSLTKSVAFNIMKETTASGMMSALSNMYEKPSAANKVFLMRELFTTRMREGGSVTTHINNINSILSRLSSVGMKFDDETQAVVLLSSMPDSWSGTITAVTSSVGTNGMTFDGIRDLILGEDIRRKNQAGTSSSEALHMGRGRENSRNSGSRGRSSSRTRKNVRCWSCNEVGHVKSQCPKSKKKDLNAATEDGNFSDDALILSVESSMDSWVLDSGASFHAMDSDETMMNLKQGDFGKVHLANDQMLDVTGMGDVNLTTPLGTTWNLKNVRVIPGLKTKLISVSQLDEQGLEVKFGNGKWKVVNGNLVIARGIKQGSLYMVPVTSKESATLGKTSSKVGIAESGKTKRVHFANVKSGVSKMSANCIRRSESDQGFRNSGSTVRVPGTVPKRRWVRKTGSSNGKISPGNSLLILESAYSRCISESGGLSKPVETGDESDMTAGLELDGASTASSGT